MFECNKRAGLKNLLQNPSPTEEPLGRRADFPPPSGLVRDQRYIQEWGGKQRGLGEPGSYTRTGKEKGPEPKFGALVILSRRRPTFPHSYPCSIIGPARLNFRVRDGNGCDPRGMTTGNLVKFSVFSSKFSVSKNIGTRRTSKSFPKKLARRHKGAADNSLGWRIQVRPAAEQLLCATRRCSLV